MNKNMLITMAVVLCIVMPIVALLIELKDRKDKAASNISTIMMKKSQRSLLYRIYNSLTKFPLTRGYMDKLARRYDILCPGEPKEIAKKSMATFGLTVVLCGLLSFILFFRSPSLQGGLMSIILVCVINNEIISRQVVTSEIKLLKQIANMISDIRHNYYIHRMVDDAIDLSLPNCGKEVTPHAKKLLEIARSNNLKEEVAKYNAATNNKYLKMFLALCVSVIEDKDQSLNGQNLFTSNLEHLKKEINIEILKLEKIKFLFSGIVFVIMAVCIPVIWIRNFAVSIMPELSSFYDGKFGTVYVFIIYIAAIIIYILTNRLKETKNVIPKDYRILERFEKIPFIKRSLDNYCDKRFGKMKVLEDTLKRIGETISPRQLLLTRLIFGFVSFVVSITLVFSMHYSIREHALEDTGVAVSLDNIGYINKPDAIDQVIVDYINKYKDKKFVPNTDIEVENKGGIGDILETMKDSLSQNAAITEQVEGKTNNPSKYSREEAALMQELLKDSMIKKKELAQECASIIIKRILRYQNEYFKWYELLICIAVSVIGFYMPYLLVLYKKKVLQLSMEDEVNQFNSIIYMLMYIEHMTVKDILEELEIFAFVFKQSIRNCINEYNSGDIQALERLKEQETYEPFRRMVDNFIRCDIISIDKAFDEISSDREDYHNRRRQENEISVQKRADLAKPLSFIPAVLVVIYLMCPLMWASLQQLSGFSEAMNIM
jgi:hypothetical protein